MKSIKIDFISLISMILPFLILLACQQENPPKGEIDYFGQLIPIDTPEVFAPDIICLKNRWEGNANFSIDGKDFFFDVFTDSMRNRKIYHSQNINGVWSTPKPFSVLGGFDNQEAFINYTNNKLYYTSTRPPGEEEWNPRTWKIEKNNENNWHQPRLVDYGVDTKNGFWYPNHSQLNDSILYFGGKIESLHSMGEGEIYYYDVKLDSVINMQGLNSIANDFDPFIAPDESYILFASDREGGYGRNDLYISFKNGDDWGEPVNLGDKINTPKHELAPRVSSDGKILFFDSPWDWKQDIYWVSSSIIEKLKE